MESDLKQQRLFGIVLAAVICFWAFVLMFLNRISEIVVAGCCIVATLLLLIAIFQPNYITWLYRPWMKVAHGLNKLIINSLLSIVFLLLITPVGFLKRQFGSDVVRGGIKHNRSSAEAKAVSYRQPSPPIERSDMENPF